MTLVNKIMSVSGVQSIIHDLYAVLCVHHPSKVSFCHHVSPLHPLLPPRTIYAPGGQELGLLLWRVP